MLNGSAPKKYAFVCVPNPDILQLVKALLAHYAVKIESSATSPAAVLSELRKTVGENICLLIQIDYDTEFTAAEELLQYASQSSVGIHIVVISISEDIRAKVAQYTRDFHIVPVHFDDWPRVLKIQ